MMTSMHQRSAIRPRVGPALAAVWLALASAAVSQSVGQPPEDADVPPGGQALGNIELPRRVLADGQALAAGTYGVHLTARGAAPALATLERWVEFRQEDVVVGREVAAIVPASEIGDVAESSPPASGSSRVEVLRGNEYVRVWINRNGTHYLIHLVVG